ncbi:MAG: hypothetical protein U1E73_05195 [Planctomycetota bacterium]
MADDDGAAETSGDAARMDLDAELLAFLEMLFADGGLRELRALDVVRFSYPHKIAHVETGYFAASQIADVLFYAGHYRADLGREGLPHGGFSMLKEPPKGVYLTLNPIKRAAHSKAPGRVVATRKGEASTDVDVERRTTLLIDVDAPREVSNVSASDDEKAEAIAIAEEIRNYLTEQQWPEPIVVDSGNGQQLLYRIDLPAADDGLVERVLRGLAARFPREDGGVDQSVHNPARITRLPCTWNRKGFHTDERPHRMARVVSLPDSFDVVPTEKLQQVAELAPAVAAGQNGSTHVRRRTRRADDGIDEAVARWNADHPRSFPTSNSPCEICGSPDGLKASSTDPSRWTCFSSRHQVLGDDCNKGAGVRGDGCFTGDCLDLEAWASGRTRVQVLKDDGYLKVQRRSRRARPATPETQPQESTAPNYEKATTRESIYFHRVSGDVPLHSLVPRAVDLLVAHAIDDVYVHAGSLAHVVAASTIADSGADLRREAAPRIRPYPASILRERLDAVARWMHERETELEVKVEERWCPREVVHAVHDRGTWPGLRVLAGVTSAPVLRADLTILDQPGYDNATGLIYEPRCDYPQIPAEPSCDEVASALARLRAPFADFPLVTPADHASLLAYLLTLAARPAILGPVPISPLKNVEFDQPARGPRT